MTAAARDADLSPSAIAAIEEALRAFARALRAVQLYLPNNPARAQSVAQARQAFARVWAWSSPLELGVREQALVLDDRVVYHDAARGTESLPWLLHRDGIRALTFAPGFEEESLEALLSMIQATRVAARDDDDLVTRLWVADLVGVAYRFVETAGSVDFVLASGDRPGIAQAVGEAPLAVPSAETPPPGEGPAPIVRLDDFDSTLYFLDAREVQYLRGELAREYTEDRRTLVVASLLDIVELPGEMAASREALDVLDTLILEWLALGDYELVAYLLREAAATARRGELAPELAEALQALPARLTDGAVMTQLLQSLDERARTPAASLLEGLFTELRPGALAPLVAWLGTAGASPARAAVERASLRLAGSHTGVLAQLLEHEEEAVVRGAVRLVSQLGTPAAVPGLARLLRGDNTALRAEAVGALAEIGTPGALQALERALDDSARDVRVAALRAIGSQRFSSALPRLLEAIRRKEIRQADLGEKMALFEAFGAMCGDAGVPELDTLLNARGLLGPREPAETRACAARALGLVNTPEAVAALQKAADTKDLVVRSAVARAMRGGA